MRIYRALPFLFVFSCMFIASTAHAADTIYVTIEGARQGAFKGESARDTERGKIRATRLQYEIAAPRDAATGQAVGRRQHSPVIITKELGAASPQIFQALVTNEVLRSVRIDVMKTTPEGAEELYYTIRLTNATISHLKIYTETLPAGSNSSSLREGLPVEEVSFTFRRIDVESGPGKTAASDDLAGDR